MTRGRFFRIYLSEKGDFSYEFGELTEVITSSLIIYDLNYSELSMEV